jgi:alkyldihydroxyacetonephosphate synthase
VSAIVIDGKSLLAEVEGGLTLAEAEASLAREKLTLGLEGAPMGSTFSEWISAGAPGAPRPWLDPVDHLIAGIAATLPRGERIVMKPAPRRAAGPDLVALFFGTKGRFGAIERVWLRVHPADGGRAAPHPFTLEEPPASRVEEALFDAIARELGAR